MRNDGQVADYTYLTFRGATVIQAIAWVARYPSGFSQTDDMDDYLRGSWQCI